MKFNTSVRLVSSILTSILVSLLLYWYRPKNFNEQALGFTRLANRKAKFTDTLRITGNLFYIAGNSKDTVYLGQFKYPMNLWRFADHLQDSLHFTLKSERFSYKNLRIQVHGDDICMLDGNEAFVRKGNTFTNIMKPWINSSYFLMATPVSEGSIALMGRVNGKATLGKQNSNAAGATWFPNLIEKQVDGYFCSFGQLMSDRENDRLVYLYLYRNQYLVTDTNMNLLYRANTIDTISRAKIKTGKTTENTFSIASPPMTVNLQSCISEGKLYVQSNMRAANETLKKFLGSSPIDVYDLNKGKYLYSFYLPNRYGTKLLDFRVLNERSIAALYRDELVRYELK